ncbi:MAG: DsbA family protein [Acidimicrobiia bacterium]|nr:DsbA family protein [Acidimicrobiia bacterium]
MELIYVADPMCSWCWGFHPSMTAIADHHLDLPVRVVVGGLRPGPSAKRLDDDMRAFLLHHWQQVEERSGQPFNPAGLDREDWTYDTEMADMAVVAMRKAAPGDTLRFLGRVQRAFYAEAVDVTAAEAYGGLVAGFPVDAGSFVGDLADGVDRDDTWSDFALARSWGISGFPAVVGRQGQSGALLARGWMAPGQLDQVVHSWLSSTGHEVVDGATCAVGDIC